MQNKYTNKKRDPSRRFVKLNHSLLETRAYKLLSVTARALLIEVRMRFNGVNNGNIGLGVREAATQLNVGTATASKAFNQLMELGFIDCVKQSGFDQKRLARTWRLTDEFDSNSNLPAKHKYRQI